LVTECLPAWVAQDRAQHDVLGARDVAFLPFPVLADVNDLVSLLAPAIDTADVDLFESFLAHFYSSPGDSPSHQAPAVRTLEHTVHCRQDEYYDVASESVRVLVRVGAVLEVSEISRVVVVVEDMTAVNLLIDA